MKYFFIAFIMSCVISCGFKNPDTTSFFTTFEDEGIADAEDLGVEVTTSIERKPKSITPESVDEPSKSTPLAFKQIDTSQFVKSNPVFRVPSASDSLAGSEAVASVAESDGAKDLELASSVIPPDNKMIHDLARFVRSELRKEGMSGSHVFDWYVERMIMANASANYRDDNNKIDETRWMKETRFFKARSAAIPHQRIMAKDAVFNQLARLSFKNPMGIRQANRQVSLEKIPIKGADKKEAVLFVDSIIFDSESDLRKMNDWTKNLDNIKPDRIAVIRSPNLLDFIHGKKDFTNKSLVEVQAERLARLANYVRKHKIPLHIMGLCDYFCSSYLVPRAKEVYIEPFGEIAFNGNFKFVSDTFKNLLYMAMAREQHLNYAELNNLDWSAFKYFSTGSFNLFGLKGKFHNYLVDSGNYLLISKIENSVEPNRHFGELSDSEQRAFFSSLSLYDKNQILQFAKNEKSKMVQKIEEIQDIMKRLSLFNNHFPETAAQSVFFGGRNHTLERFFYYTGFLTNSFFAGEFHDSSKSRYFVSTEKPQEGEKNPMIAYSHISPKTTLLNKLGINVVRGENLGYRKHVLVHQGRSKLSVVPVSEAVLANCNFFRKDFDSPQVATGCFSKTINKLKNDDPHFFFSI